MSDGVRKTRRPRNYRTGYCGTGNHPRCPIVVTNVHCACPCHKTKKRGAA